MVQWDGVAVYNVMPNTLISATGQSNAQIGGTYLNGVFTAPAAPAPAQGVLFFNSPVSGASLNIPDAPQPYVGSELHIILDPAAALASITLNMPPQPQDGDHVYLLSTKAITTVNVAFAPGQGSVNIPASFALAANVSVHCKWYAQLGPRGSWVKL